MSVDPVLVVEGADDYLVLREHLGGAQIFPVDGKANALEAARTLAAWGVKDFLCVTDWDFDDGREYRGLEHVHHPYAGRDLESMLISLGVLCNVLDHQGSSQKLRALGGPESLIGAMKEELSPVTAVRYANACKGLGLAFDKVNLAGKVDIRSGRINVQGWLTALRAASNADLSHEDLVALTDTPLGDDRGPRGKDVLALAGAALRRRAGSLALAASTDLVLCGQLLSSCGLALARSEWLAELLSRLGLGSGPDEDGAPAPPAGGPRREAAP